MPHTQEGEVTEEEVEPASDTAVASQQEGGGKGADCSDTAVAYQEKGGGREVGLL